MAETVTETSLTITRTFKATRDQVFKAWTEPEQMKLWMAPGPMTVPSAEADLRVGGRYRISMSDGANPAQYIAVGEYREIIPPEKLVYTWAWEAPEKSPDTLVTIILREVEGGTEMELKHEQFSDEKSRDDHKDGWNGCFAKLEEVFSA